LAATIAVVIAGVVLELPRHDWFFIIVAIVGVWVAEALNTALEALANAAIPNIHPLVRNAKDVAAGGVLLAALGAMTIGGLVFVPRLSQLIH
jgi:diacylglycerol kinase (ATP)